MPLVLRETDTASDDPFDASGGCSSGFADNSTTSSKQATSGGTAGVTAVSLTLDAQNANLDTIQFESAAGEPNSTAWESGTWTVRIEITTSNKNITGWDVAICRRNSAGVPQERLGNGIGVGGFASTGVKTAIFTGNAAVGELATDQIGITIAPLNSTTMTQTFGYKPSQNIDTPVNQGVAGGDGTDFPWQVFHSQPILTPVAVISY